VHFFRLLDLRDLSHLLGITDEKREEETNLPRSLSAEEKMIKKGPYLEREKENGQGLFCNQSAHTRIPEGSRPQGSERSWALGARNLESVYRDGVVRERGNERGRGDQAGIRVT